jgi:hypothetical protein
MHTMDMNKIKKIVADIDMSSHDMKPVLAVGTCSATGRPKVSVGLHASDNRLPVQSGIKAGGIAWPPHTIVLDSDDEKHVVASVIAALDMATAHENREHVKYKGVLFENPHAEAAL